jgi:hypothetical protein
MCLAVSVALILAADVSRLARTGPVVGALANGVAGRLVYLGRLGKALAINANITYGMQRTAAGACAESSVTGVLTIVLRCRPGRSMRTLTIDPAAR